MQTRMKNGMTRLFFATLGIFLLSLAAVADASTVQNRYDELDRLYRAEYGDGTVVEYVYDNVGNRIALQRMAVILSSNPADNATTGNIVTFTGSATCPGPYEYEFQGRFPGGTWGTVRGYTTDNTWTWNTTGAPATGYEFQVNVRTVGSSAAEGTATIPYTLQ